ncbi:MAG: tetratricopeptide repeat protein [Pseudomonadota bacterium]
MIISLGIVTSAALISLEGLAQNAETPPGVPETEALEEQVLPPPKPEVTKETTRTQHLDSLFALLADPTTQDWEPIASQIAAAWNRSGSASMDLLARRADSAMEEKDYDTALLHLNDLTRLAPEFAEGWNKRATLYFIREEYGRSLEDIAQTLRREPRHFGALSGLGIILDRIGDKEGALEAYRRAIKIHPHLPGANEGIRKLAKEVEGQRL